MCCYGCDNTDPHVKPVFDFLGNFLHKNVESIRKINVDEGFAWQDDQDLTPTLLPPVTRTVATTTIISSQSI